MMQPSDKQTNINIYGIKIILISEKKMKTIIEDTNVYLSVTTNIIWLYIILPKRKSGNTILPLGEEVKNPPDFLKLQRKIK